MVAVGAAQAHALLRVLMCILLCCARPPARALERACFCHLLEPLCAHRSRCWPSATPCL